MLKILVFFTLFVTVFCENTNLDTLIDQIFGPTTAKAIQETDKTVTKVDEANKPCTTADGIEGECVKIDKNADLYAVIDEIFGPTTAEVNQDPAKRAAKDEANITCTTRDGLKGECVVYYLCNATNTNTDQATERYVSDGDCLSYLDVCCHKSHKIPEDHYKKLVKRSPFDEEKERMAEKTAVQDPILPVSADTSNGDVSCQTWDLKQGKCVPYYLCNSSVINTEDVDIRHDEVCPSYLEECCKETDIILSLDDIKSRRRRSTYNDVKVKQDYGNVNTTEAKNDTQEPDVPAAQSIQEFCKTEDGKQGECVPYYLCNAQNIGDSVGVIDIIVPNERGCSSYMDVCCEKADKTSYKPLKREGCGWANPDGLRPHKASTGETRFGEFPWMVAVFEKVLLVEDNTNSPKLNKYVGGGSLIHPSVVLTVAHNVHDKKEIKIRAGDWDVHTVNEPYPYQDRDVASIEIHKDFIEKTLFYDIALLFLTKPVELAPNVGVVCLPAPRVPQEDGTRCLATGWGKDKFGKEGSYSSVLKKVELPVVSHGRCENILRTKTRLGEMFILHSTFMCAGGEKDKDTCTGDGGSPLSCPIAEDRFIQSGIVAWGVGCGTDGVPSVYVDVSTLRDWIDDKVIGKGYDPKVYTYVRKDNY